MKALTILAVPFAPYLLRGISCWAGRTADADWSGHE